MNKTSEEYRLATEISMFLADKLNEHGIKTVVVTEEKAKEALEQERVLSAQGRSNVEFSMRDIMNLSYTWNGEEVSMRGFAEQFMSEIKQKDRTIEDAERIAKAFIEAVKADPEKAGMKMLKAENMANAFRFKLPDGTIYTPEHPMATSPEYETQKGLWEIYEYVLGKETMREFIGLLSKNAPMSPEERKRYSELESRVNGSDIMQQSLEIPASKVNENRVKDIRNLIQYFEGNDDYTWTEKALIVKGAMSFGYSEKKEADSTRVEIKNISDNNSVSVPVIGGEAAAVAEGLRKGLNFKDALVQARIMLSKESKRSVGGNFTGWKVYKQSYKEEDAVILNQDVAGTGWCTGGAVSTARSHLSGGDFHVYYEAGEPLIAIRTENGRMAEPPRGAHEGQFCTDREEQIAFDYIRSGNGIIAGDDYIADIEDIRRIMSPDATPLDAFLMPGKRRYENGEFGGDTEAWGESVEQRIAELIPDKKEERWKLGLYYGNEIEDACKNGNAIAIKGDIELYGSASLTLPEGVTLQQVENIHLRGSISLTIPDSVTQVGDIELAGSASLTLPEGVTQVGNIALSDSTSLILPEGVTQVGNIALSDSTSLTIPDSVTQVGYISLSDSNFLTLPESMAQVGDIVLFGAASLTLPEGVTQVGNIKLYDSNSLTLPEGVTQVKDIVLQGSASLTLPAGVTQVKDINLYGSTSLTLPDGVTKVREFTLTGSSSLILSEGVTQVGNIILRDSTSLTLPKGMTQVGDIKLYGSSSLTLSKGVTKVEYISLEDSASLTLPEGVTQVGFIALYGSTSLTITERITHVGEIHLSDSASLILPNGVTQVGIISLDDSASLTLPEGVTQVECITLRSSASLILSKGVTQVGAISLYNSSSLTLPEGVKQVGSIFLFDSTPLTLPKGVTQVGSIILKYSSSLTLSEGVTQVGDIYLHDSTSLTLPEGVTQVGRLELSDSASLTLPKGVTKVGEITLTGSSFLILSEGVTQVGDIRLTGSSSLILPEGVTPMGNIVLHGSASLALPKGMTQVGGITLTGSSSLILPEGVTQVRDIGLSGSASLVLPEGVTQVGNICLQVSSSLTLPEGVTQVGNISLYDSSSLILPEGVTQVGSVILTQGASITFPDGFVLSTSKTYSAEEINQLFSEHQKKQEFRLADGTIYGYQQGDTIYLTPAGINPNTPIHEYAHLWTKVYEKLHPAEWASLKEELKALSQWQEIAESESYSFIESDENRLAGEVLATIIGNRGEEIMLSTAKESLKEGGIIEESVVKGAEYFRRKVTDMAVKDVFDAEGLERIGEVTLKILKDFADGKGMKIRKEEGEKLAAMADVDSGIEEKGISERWSYAVYAPNGKLSNLSKEDYEYAHSDAFKRIVGDWESARIIKQARIAWSDESSKNRTNFIPSEEFISEVKNLTGLDTRLVVILDDSIRHIKNHHGSKEVQRGQIDMTPEDIATIPYIINNFDSIVRAPDYDNLNGGFALTVTKRINGLSYVGIINKGKRNEIVISAWNKKTSAALDASIKDTPGLYVQDDTDLVTKVKKDIETIKHSAENVLIPFDENGEPTAEAVEIVRRIDALDLIAAQEENRGLFEQGYKDSATEKVAQIEKQISKLRQKLVGLSKSNQEEYLDWQYYGVFLDDKSQKTIGREFQDLIPLDWKKYADHVTVLFNDHSQETNIKGQRLSRKLGEETLIRIIAVGKSDTAIALKVEGIETANKIAHITLAVSPEGKPVDSNKITEWTPVTPIEVSGALGFSNKGKKFFQIPQKEEFIDFQVNTEITTQQETDIAKKRFFIENKIDDITLRKEAPGESREERRARLRERSEKNTHRWSNNIKTTADNKGPKIKR